MRMPKHRGFKRYYKLVTPVQTVNLEALQNDEKVIDVVTKELLLQLGYIRTADVAVKVLGT
jgi:ribosomal protein L15